jgi:subtilisin family serine protease
MFVAGILAGRARTASINVTNHLVRHGVVLESALAAVLDTALDQNPHVINMSAGTTTADNTPPIALSVVNDKLKTKQTMLVAAAGNDQSATEKFWPAAFPNVISVGALDEWGVQAGYSNFGPWVQVWARGSNIVNAYPKGAYQYAEPPYGPGDTVTFPQWLARWSGTSFAAPIVAGRIAAYLAANGGTPQAAWNAVRGSSQPNGPGGRPVITP